jgi:hypothetical protein
VEADADADDVWRGLQQQREREAWLRRASRPVVVVAGEEGSPPDASAGSGESGGVGRARSLTDDDLEELKGCVDLGFGFSYREIPELCGTLPALDLCYSMSQRFLDEHHHQQLGKAEEAPPLAPASPAQPAATTNWKISSPGNYLPLVRDGTCQICSTYNRSNVYAQYVTLQATARTR